MRKKVTIQDIADELGISRNTVSKAFNNAEGLAPATREKIIQKAMEMDYKQFSYVRTVAGIADSDLKHSEKPSEFYGEIALLTTQFLSPSHFSALMLDTFQRELSLLGYTLNTHRVTEENIINMSLPITFQKNRVSAIICFEMFNREYDQLLCDLDLPVLFVDGPNKIGGRSLPADQLYMNNYDEVARFISDMLKRGYRKLGFIGNYEHCQSFFERYNAFRSTIHVSGYKIEEKFIVRENTGLPLVQKLNALEELPEVFFCVNDFVAIEAISALNKRGIRVPDDVLFCGFDDSPESRIITPALTTIHIHTQVMAFSAIHLLMSRIKEPSLDFRTVYTQCDLIYRASTKD